jgi:hypothetical protein
VIRGDASIVIAAAQAGALLRGNTMRHWLDYDCVALAVLMIGIGIVELIAFTL